VKLYYSDVLCKITTDGGFIYSDERREGSLSELNEPLWIRHYTLGYDRECLTCEEKADG